MGNMFQIVLHNYNHPEITKDLIGEIELSRHNPNYVLWRLIPKEVVLTHKKISMLPLYNDGITHITMWIILSPEYRMREIFEQLAKNIRYIAQRYQKRCESLNCNSNKEETLDV